MRKSLALATALTATALLMAGCGDPTGTPDVGLEDQSATPTVPVETAPQVGDSTAACDALSTFDSRLEDLDKTLTADSTVDEAKQARAKLDAAADAFDTATKGNDVPGVQELGNALKTLVTSIDGMGDLDVPLGDMAITLADQSGEVAAASSQVAESLGCPAAS